MTPRTRKLPFSDGTVRWKSFAGGWPFVSGIDLTPDDAWLAAGTRRLDASLVRTSNGRGKDSERRNPWIQYSHLMAGM
ncbi:MAG: hypothetical protein ABIO94_11355 [Opitutaceae bacterium]